MSKNLQGPFLGIITLHESTNSTDIEFLDLLLKYWTALWAAGASCTVYVQTNDGKQDGTSNKASSFS